MYKSIAFLVTVFMGFVGFWIGESFNSPYMGHYFSVAAMGCFILSAIEKQEKH
ncbi:hypothetical protein [Lutispora saccharofermentans]|uniref:Uncharacterized protein n=1 Tax=Lutispora saccharofermentans TaxID=3024236 RepID=A0ABT1NL33_9FIRM|nr:hypothetical protein [Lutispora saccharofermentans]MCQ1530991.1 hypothetical protein [Lutispora saccharofermentans]